MVRYIVGGTLLGGVLVVLGGLILGANVNVTSSSNVQHYGTGKHVLRVEEVDGVKTYTVVDSETGSARRFNEEDGMVLLEGVSDDSSTP